MACKWTYQGKVYSEGEFIALMAKSGDYEYLFPDKISFGQRVTKAGEDMERGIDEWFNQNPTMGSFIPPSAIKVALKSAARIIKAGGKLFTAVENAVRELSKITGEKYNEMQKDVIRQIASERLKRFQQIYVNAVTNSIPGTTPYREMLDALFNDLESQIDTMESGAEVAIAIEDFLKTYKDQLKGLSSKRIMSLMTNALKAQTRNDIKRFIRKAKNILSANVEEGKIDAVESMQKEVKKNLGKYTNVVPEVAKFLGVDAEMLAEDDTMLDEYLKAITDLNQKGVKGTGKMMELLPKLGKFLGRQKARAVTGMNAVIEGYTTVDELQTHVDNVLSSIQSVDELKLASREISMIARRAQELKDEAIQNGDTQEADNLQAFLDNYLPTKFSSNANSTKLQGIIKQLKDALVKSAKAVQVQLNKIPSEYHESINEFTSWSEEDLMRLDPAQLMTYTNVKNELNNGYVAPQLHDLNNKIAALKKANAMASGMNQATTKYANMKSWRAKAAKTVSSLSTTYTEDSKNELLTIAKSYWDDMLGTQETRAFWRNIIYPVSKATVESQKGMERDLAGLNEALNGLKTFSRRWLNEKDSKDFSRTMSKLGLIMAQMDYQANNRGWDEMVGSDKDYYTQALKKTNDVPKDKLKIDQEAYEQLKPYIKNGYLDAQAALASLSPEERKVYDEFRKLTDSSESKVKLMMEKRGEVFNKQTDYYPRNILTDSKSMADETINSVLSMFGVGGGKVITRASATQKRVDSAVNYYNLNIEEVANKHARQVNLDYHVTDQVKRVLSSLSTLINEAKDNNDIEKANTLSSIKSSVEESLKTELGSQVPYRTAFNSLINTLTKLERNLTLSNPVRIFTEGLSNMVRTGAIPRKITMKELAEIIPALPSSWVSPDAVQWDMITDELGSSVYLKGGKFAMEARDVNKTSLAKMNNLMMQFADAVNAKQLWVNEFKDSFKKTTGVEFNTNNFNDPAYRERYKDAIETAGQDAELMVNRMYNSQTGFIAPAHIQLYPRTIAQFFDKKGSTGREDTAAKLLGYMNTFAANESAMSRMLLKSIVEGNDPKAAGQLARLVLSNYMFTLFTTFASGMLKGMFDDEDDNVLESAWAPFKKGAAWKGAVSTLLSMGIGKYANLFRLGTGVLMGMAEDGDDNQEVSNVVEGIRDIMYIKPIILSSEKRDPRNQFDYVVEQVAPGAGGAASNMFETVKSVKNIVVDGFSDDKDIQSSDLLLAGRGGLYLSAYLSGGIPGAAFGARILKANIKIEQIDERREEKIQTEMANIKEEKENAGEVFDRTKERQRAARKIDRDFYRNTLKKQRMFDAKKIKEKMIEWDAKHPKIE